VRPVVGQEEVAGTEVEEGETRSVEGDVEAVLDVCDDRVLVDVVVARVDYTESFGVAFLGCADGCPEDAFAASSCIAMVVVSVLSQWHGGSSYQKGWKKPMMPSHSWADFPWYVTLARRSLSDVEGVAFSSSVALLSSSSLLVCVLARIVEPTFCAMKRRK
jgi:hypothetical protein